MSENNDSAIQRKEKKIDVPNRLKIESQDAYKNVRLINAFDFVENTYFGSEGYLDCSYLIPHPREVFYETRRSSSYYINVFASVINAMVDAVFQNQISRKSSSSDFDDFINNADGLGASLQESIEDAMYQARLNDVAFIVMDNYSSELQPATMKEVQQQRIYPYIYLKRMQDVKSIEEDRTGRLTAIDFFDGRQKINEADKPKEVDVYRRWTNQTWETYYKNGNSKIPIAQGEHGLGVLPVIPITEFSRRKKISQIKWPSNYNLAYLCYALFNKESEIVSMEANQCFSIFYVSGRLNTTTIGHNNIIEVPTDAKFPPNYTSPNPAMMDGLVKNSDRLAENIYKMARQKGVIALVEQSGVAKQWDFRGEEGVLKRTALAAKNTEMKIAELFGLYTGKKITLTSEYPNEFSPTYQRDLVSRTLEELKEMPPASLQKRLWLRLARQEFGEDKQSGDTLIQELEEEIKQAQADAKAGTGEEASSGEGGEPDEEGAAE